MKEFTDNTPFSDDALEAELRGFRLAAPSPQLFDRIQRELQREVARDGRTRRGWHRVAGSLLAAAACIVVAVLAWHSTRPSGRDPVVIGLTVPGAVTLPLPDVDRPALATYQRALARSPEALDALLDRHAARVLPGGDARRGTGPRLTAASGLDMLR